MSAIQSSVVVQPEVVAGVSGTLVALAFLPNPDKRSA
jgi:hypothetical protein